MINITTKIKPRYVEPRNGEVRLDAPGLVEHQSVDSPAHLLVHPVAGQHHRNWIIMMQLLHPRLSFKMYPTFREEKVESDF